MKTLVVACVAALAALAAADNWLIVDKYDWHGLLGNKAKWNPACQCILDKAPCGDLQPLKEGVKQRLKTNCGECTPEQRELYDEVVKLLKDLYPEDYKKIMDHVAKD